MSGLTVKVTVGLAAVAFLAAFHFGARRDAVTPAPALAAARPAAPQPAPPAAPRLVLSRVVPLPALRHVPHHRRPATRRTAAPLPTPSPTATPAPSATATPAATPAPAAVPTSAPRPTPSYVGQGFDSKG